MKNCIAAMSLGKAEPSQLPAQTLSSFTMQSTLLGFFQKKSTKDGNAENKPPKADDATSVNVEPKEAAAPSSGSKRKREETAASADASSPNIPKKKRLRSKIESSSEEGDEVATQADDADIAVEANADDESKATEYAPTPDASDVEKNDAMDEEDDDATESAEADDAKSAPKSTSGSNAESATADKNEGVTEVSKKKKSDANEASKPSTATSSKSGGSKSKASGANAAFLDTGAHSVSTAWKAGEDVPYSVLTDAFERIEKTSGRLDKITILSDLFRSIIALTPDHLLYAVYLSTCQLKPRYENVELGIGEGIIVKLIAQISGKKVDAVKKEAIEVGDLGTVARTAKSKQRVLMFAPKPKKLTLKTVYETLLKIAKLRGSGVEEEKKRLIEKLLASGVGSEAQYVVRSLLGKMRINLAEKSVLTALARAAVLAQPKLNAVVTAPPSGVQTDEEATATSSKPTKSRQSVEERIANATEIMSRVFCEMPSYDKIVPTMLEHGLDGLLERCHLTVGTPVHPMLAHPTKSITEVLDRFKDSAFTCEWKYDGERAQIHKLPDGTVNIYSRNLENNTGKYPDVIASVAQRTDADSYILDSEVVAYDPETKSILPFQMLSKRAKKNVEAADVKVKVCIYAFDLLYLNGKSLLRETFRTRRRLLHEHFTESEGDFQFATHRDLHDVEDIQEFLHESIKGKCEGLMVKRLDVEATYEPSVRSRNWLKVKKDYLDGLGDSLDLVPIGAYHGSGKRTGGYGGYLLAAYNEDEETFQTVCKIGTGFSDEVLASLTSFFKPHVIERKRDDYDLSEKCKHPDVFFDAVTVWEVLAGDLSISPVHTAANTYHEAGKGVALRFPRYVRTRDDKKPEEATNTEQVWEMYSSQASVQTSTVMFD